MSMAQRRQKTKPARGEPVEIPVPKRSAIDRLLKKAAQPLTTRRTRK
jgi:hypothetical protein